MSSFTAVGLPPGVVNLVMGMGPKAGAAIVRHPDVPVISFTGSTVTGQAITEMTAPFYKKTSLEVSTVLFSSTKCEYNYMYMSRTWCRYFKFRLQVER